MASGRRGTVYILVGLALLVAGGGVFAWEQVQHSDLDIELISLPLLLIGLFLLFDGILARRRDRLLGDNPK